MLWFKKKDKKKDVLIEKLKAENKIEKLKAQNEIEKLKSENEIEKLKAENEKMKNKFEYDLKDAVQALGSENEILKKNRVETFEILDHVKKNKEKMISTKNSTKHSLREVLHFEGEKNGILFEDFIRDLFVSSGYTAERTEKNKDGGDGGKDVIVELEDLDVWIEAKMLDFKKGNLVQKNVIEKLHSTIEIQKKNRKKVKGVLITTYFLNIETKMYAKECGIEVIDRKGLFELVDALCPNVLDGYSWKEDRKNFEICKKCNGFKINRTNKTTYKIFSGCVNYNNQNQACNSNNPLNVKYLY